MRVRPFALLVFMALLAPAARAAECQSTRLLPDRTVVIAPCTELLARSDLPLETRLRAHEHRARGLIYGGRWDDAERDAEAGLALSGHDASLLRLRSQIRRHQQRWQEAWDDGSAAVEHAPNDPLNHAALIDILLDAGDVDNARELLEHALSIAPDSIDLKARQYEVFHRGRQFPAAIKALDDIAASPRADERALLEWIWHGRVLKGDVAISLLRANALAKSFDHEAAALAFDDLVRKREDVVTLTERAAFRFGRPVGPMERSWLKDALADADAALAIDPTYARAQRTRGVVLFYQKAFEPALDSYNEALRLDPDNADYSWERGRVFRALRRFPEAEADFADFVRKDPNNLGPLLRKLARAGFYEAGREAAAGLTPAVMNGLQACARDPRCW